MVVGAMELPTPPISPTPTKTTKPLIIYRECLKNHAASIGGHALDGCGEFMAASDPTELICAACGCHRNFHRPHHHFLPLPPSPSPSPSPTPSPPRSPPAQTRKRFRTKFSQEQKEKMWAFAERVGWKMQGSQERVVEQLCSEIGVRRGVLKVWMHNNKHSRPSTNGYNNNINNNNGNHHHHKQEDAIANSNLNSFCANGSSSSS